MQDVGSWWSPATPDDVRAEQKRVDAARAGVATALVANAPGVVSPDAGWTDVDHRASAFVAEQPSVFWFSRDDQVKRGQALETEIESWRARFASQGTPMPPAPAPPPASADPLTSIANIGELAKWALIFYVASQFLSKR